jgi:spermidine synthase
VGSLFAVDVLFGSFDLVTSVRLGAVLSLSCAISALLAARLVRRNHPDTHIETEQPATSAATLNPRSPFGLATWITVYALSGFIALSLEIVWFRLLGVILKSRSDTFGHLLAGYLGGVGLGALVANHRRVRSGRPEPAFFLLQSAIPLVAAASVVFFVVMIDRVPWLNPLWQYLGEYEPAGRRGRFLALYLGIPAVLMILPTLMMGLSFGHLQHAVQTDLKTLGRRVGWLQTANIAGSMIGAILTGAGLLDWFGTAGTLRLLVCCSIPFLLLYLQTDPRRIWAAAGAGLVALLLAYSIPSPTILWARLHGAAPENVIQAEDASGVSALKMSNGSDLTIVHANGLGQSSLPYGGIHTVLGALPAMTHGKPESIAVIGLGSGDTLFAIGGRSETRIIDSIEIVAPQLNTLDHLLRRRFYPGLQMILQDDRVHHWFTDGRAFIRKGPPRYDIVEADALRPTSAFAGNLFSVEYFELLRSRLKPGGLAVTWIATPRVLNTFVKVFPHVVAFEGLALGSMEPVRFDPVELQGRIQQTAIRQYYLRGGVDIVKLLTPYFSASPRTYGPEFDRTTLEDVNRDLFPKDEFSVRYMRR